MSRFLPVRIYLLLLLSGNGEGKSGSGVLHDDSVEDEGDIYDMEIFLSKRRHQDGDDAAAME